MIDIDTIAPNEPVVKREFQKVSANHGGYFIDDQTGNPCHCAKILPNRCI